MKKKLILFLLANSTLLAGTGPTVTTQTLTGLSSYYLMSTYFTDANTGWVVGSDFSAGGNIIWKTTDGGTSWNPQTVPVAAVSTPFRSVFFLDANTGYVVGDHGSSVSQFVKTTDGGATWTTTTGPGGSYDESGVVFTSASVGYVTYSYGIAKTTNGGSNWSINGTSQALYGLIFSGTNNGYAFGSTGGVIASTDAGGTWTNIGPPSSTKIFKKGWAINANTIIAVGYSGALQRTTDGGSNWSTISSPAGTSDLYDICFVNSTTGYIVGSYTIMKTTDAGQTWSVVSGAAGDIYSICYVQSSSTFYMAGGSGVFYKMTDNSILPVELSSFTVSAAKSSVALKWQTATETNNYGFDIERRTISSATWTKIGFVAGNGTSNALHRYSFADNLTATGTYAYRLKQIDNNGAFKYSSESEVTLAPYATALHQNYPNPFNPTTQISYDVATVSIVRLTVYDILGREVAVLINEQKEPGSYSAVFNASQLSSGLYFYRLESGSYSESKKLILMK